MNEILWQPDPDRCEAAQVSAFGREAGRRWNRELSSWADLHQWSIDHREEFWTSVWELCGVRASRQYDQVLDRPDAMPGSRWFTGARLNYAENLLHHLGDDPAIISVSEASVRRELSWNDLHDAVTRFASALNEAGVEPGDRVAGFLPNVPEAVIAMLATTSLGAVWSSCSPDFGTKGVLDRFGQIAPKVLVVADGYVYAGKQCDVMSTVVQLQAELPGLKATVLVPFLKPFPDLSSLKGAVLWDDYLAAAPVRPLRFYQTSFDHPLFIMYSSGTTGLPKCMVHSVGGTLLQHLKEHRLHTDLGPSDRLFYFTTCGWMMWNWMVGALASGTTLVLYDGSAVHPKEALWSLAATEKVTVFGTSARYLAACESFKLVPGATNDLSALRAVLSTGSVLSPESFEYVYREVGADLQLSSISGGTDIISCFALGSPVLPVRKGELQCLGLGMDVAVVDDRGAPQPVGQPGELVCRKSFPSMPTKFWNDPDGLKYHAAYFERYPAVWHHGDWAEMRPEGGLMIHGRSDAVLNPGGVRIGTSEIYRVIEQFDEVVESLVTAQKWENDERVVLFVHLKDGVSLDDEMRERIRLKIKREETPRHVPARIVQVPAIPRTISGKIVELAVRRVIHGMEVPNKDALANPDVLEFYRDREELRT